jgi:aminoglycoside phosphotransferase (APT) family kinase protein
MFEIDAAPEVIRDYARQIAKLHQINLDSAGIRPDIEFGDSEFPVRKMVMDSYAKHRARTADDLLLETAHIWMIENLDCVDRGSALVHGDAGFHNVLCEDGRMTALLDWELAHAGDPAEDLMKCKAAASQVISWAEFMDIYVQSGGKAISPERERFFTIWRMVSFSMFAADARVMFESGEDPDLRLAAVGYNTFNRLHDALARELASI